MFNTDMFGNKRFYVKGNKEDAERFTVDLAWYHSARANFGSINEDSDGLITINLIANYDDDEDWFRRYAKKFNLIGFTSFDELKN